MGYEIFLILPAIYLVTKGVASSMLTVRSRLTVKLVSYFLYFFFLSGMAESGRVFFLHMPSLFQGGAQYEGS